MIEGESPNGAHGRVESARSPRLLAVFGSLVALGGTIGLVARAGVWERVRALAGRAL